MTTLKDALNAIRKPAPRTGRAAAQVVAAFAVGVALGAFAKRLDTLAIDGSLWRRWVMERLDLGNFFSDIAIWLLIALAIAVFSASAPRAAGNVFAFFAGMCGAYHLCTILLCGFHPAAYMRIWYALALLSPLLAALCWYAKGSGAAAILLDTGIVAVFALSCFSIGILYVGLRGVLYALVFAAMLAVLYRSPAQLLVSLTAGLLLAFLLSPLWPYR